MKFRVGDYIRIKNVGDSYDGLRAQIVSFLPGWEAVSIRLTDEGTDDVVLDGWIPRRDFLHVHPLEHLARTAE